MATEEIVVRAILAVAVLMAMSHLCAALARRIGQPAVVGRLCAGIVLGPSVLGQFPGDPAELLFPRQIVPALTVVAQIALVLFLFTAGYEFDAAPLRRRVRAVPFVAVAGAVTPLLLGAGSTVLFAGWYRGAADPGVPHRAFVVFIAVSFALTAVPVLISIMQERGLTGTVPGVVALGAAGVMDVAGWLLLSWVLLQASDAGHRRPLLGTTALLLVYVLVMVLAVRPALRSWLARCSPAVAARRMPMVATFAMASAWVTGALGLHVILGALLAGLVMPRRADGAMHPEILVPVEKAGNLLLPVFFVVSGLSTDIGALRGADVLLLIAVCVIATVGKLGAGLLGARAAGLPWRTSAVVGVLINTRGLTELVALNAGLQAGIIDTRLYTVFVLMALFTTAATGPMLALLPAPGGRAEGGAGGTVLTESRSPASP